MTLTVSADGQGGSKTTLTELRDNKPVVSLSLSDTTTLNQGVSLINAAPTTSADAFAVWAAARMSEGTLTGVSFHLPGFDHETGTGMILSDPKKKTNRSSSISPVMEGNVSVFRVTLGAGQENRTSGISAAVNMIGALDRTNGMAFARGISAAQDSGMVKSLWVSFATGLGTAVFNLLSSASGRQLLAKIAGVASLGLPANIKDLSSFGAYVKETSLANASLWKDDNGDGEAQDSEMKPLAQVAPEAMAAVRNSYVSLRSGGMSLGRGTDNASVFAVQMRLKDEHGHTFGQLSQLHREKRRGDGIHGHSELGQPGIAALYMPLIAALMGFPAVRSMEELRVALLTDPGVRARFKTTPIVFDGGETTLFDFVGGERFFSLLAEGQVNLAAAQLSLGSLAGNFFARTSFTIVDSSRKALAHFSGALKPGSLYERRLSPE
ncbi:MAG: hypothetical protein IPP70_09890 [Elusimicrobia bacterium]|nr:hypothetical protein [Elusimicrobiota bacterium]